MVLSNALLREISPKFAPYHRSKGRKVDEALLEHQFAMYKHALTEAGVLMRVLASDPERPDCVFIEDTAVVWDGSAMITRMDEHREGEQAAIEAALGPTHRIEYLPEGARLEGGDVLHTESETIVGISKRTNHLGYESLNAFMAVMGRRSRVVEVSKCLHLKTGATYLGHDTFLASAECLDAGQLAAHARVILTHKEEMRGANVVNLGSTILCSADHPRTLDAVQAFGSLHGIKVVAVPTSEIERADGSLTCLSLVW